MSSEATRLVRRRMKADPRWFGEDQVRFDGANGTELYLDRDEWKRLGKPSVVTLNMEYKPVVGGEP